MQARQLALGLDLEAAPSLAGLQCSGCGALGVTVVALGRNDNGAYERCFCAIDPCARAAGWPWLAVAPERVPNTGGRHARSA